MKPPTTRALAIGLMLLLASLPALALEPFVATYDAYRSGKLAGQATMRVAPSTAGVWQAGLRVRGNRGLAGLVGLDIEQTCDFTAVDGVYRPLRQSMHKRALFTGRKSAGIYDWRSRTATWTGVDKDRQAPVPLLDEDLTGLLMNLAVIRDAAPGRTLAYRVVENGRAREHRYAVATLTEAVRVEELSYEAMRVARINGGNDETIFWIASGVPTPVRILQRDNGADTIDLRLVEYQGVK